MGRVDAHQHFWRFREGDPDYAWISPAMPALKRDFLPQDLLAAQTGLGFEGSIAVQARQSLEETRWLLRLAAQSPPILGVVGWVDLCAGSLSEQLAEFQDHPKFKGVRHVLQDEPDDRFMLRADFLRGLERVEMAGLSYDLLVFPRQLPAAVELAKKFPNLRLVLDHLAKPPVRSGLVSPWLEDLSTLAACPNVSCKLSGLVTEADWLAWKSADLEPYLKAVLARFGASRLMFGSDWPVCNLAAPYATVSKLIDDFVGQHCPGSREAIFGHNARRFYHVAGEMREGA